MGSSLGRRCLFVAGCVLAGSTAHAERFSVTARIFCPASWNSGPETLENTFTSAPLNVPCAGIRVVAMDADPGFDEYCGGAFTDSRGMVSFGGECGDTAGGRPEVYLEVQGRSVNGFTVGVPSWHPLDPIIEGLERGLDVGVPLPVPVVDKLRRQSVFDWLGSERLVGEGGRLDLGDLAIGGGGPVSLMAARQFWIAQYTMFRLRAGTRYLPMDFKYTVNAPIGFPTTVYDTVNVGHTRNEGQDAADALRATAHEIGHVLYNSYHSSMTHWLLDAPDYMTDHGRCDTDHFQTLAWYEGFANFVRDYVFQKWDWPAADWTAEFEPFAGCALTSGEVDMSVEGNVQGMLNAIFFGPVPQAVRDGIGQPKAEDFSCPPGQTRIVTAAGVVECERQEPASCARGLLDVDRTGDIDQCLQVVPDPSCRPRQSCEPVEQVVASSCPAGRALRRPGPDSCTLRSPARHVLPNGQPRPRPDGTPNMVLGRHRDGGLAWFSLPDLDDVVKWVSDAGTDGHRAREVWQGWIRPWCQTRNGLRYHYCHPNQSATFQNDLQTLDPAFN